MNQGFDLDDYSVMAVLAYMPGKSVRAWGGWSQQNFAYNDNAGTTIDLTAAAQINLIAARHDADWGRAAHEFRRTPDLQRRAPALSRVPAATRVRLPPRGEARMDLLVVPVQDSNACVATSRTSARDTASGASAPPHGCASAGLWERSYPEVLPVTEVPGSWFTSIGGLSARVEPKRKADVKLEEDTRHVASPTLLALRGRVFPAEAGQTLRVDLQSSDGVEAWIIATTGDNGAFEAQFDLEKLRRREPEEQGTNPRPVLERPDPLSGLRLDNRIPARPSPRLDKPRPTATVLYEAQAHILNASQLAPATSNAVRVDKPVP